MNAKHTLTLLFENKGMKLRTWAFSNGLSKDGTTILYDLGYGKLKGSRGRAKELRELLEKDGFLKKVKKTNGTDGENKAFKKGA